MPPTLLLKAYKTHDINIREIVILSALLIPVVYFGIFPKPVFRILASPMNTEIFLNQEQTNSETSSQTSNYIMQPDYEPLPSLKTTVELNVLPKAGKEVENGQD